MFAVLRFGAWTLSAACVLLLASLPVGLAAQATLSGLGILTMIALWPFRTRPGAKHLFLAVGTLIALRYIYWRTTSTLPPPSHLIDFVPGLILYAAEIYCVLMLAISLFVVADPLKRKQAPILHPAKLPTVDVFVPSYNETADLLATTLAAAKSLDYPAEKLTVFLLDDGGTDAKIAQSDPVKAAAALERRQTLQALAADLGVVYHARARNEHAKAGNLNAGMSVSNGELIAVFDADHAPFRAFLTETVGHFSEDEKLFLVQTPHVFLNPDPIERNLSTFERMPSENEMFYGLVQQGLDRWNAAFFCGSAAVLRRTALESVGGFSGQTITEDCETALELHSRGWNSAYVDTPLIAGLQPESFANFIGQRSRWCQGMIQILMLKNPLFKRGLNLAQRVSYLSNAMFWFFPLARLVFMLAPLLYIFFSIEIYVANLQEMVAYTLTYMAASILMQNYLYGRLRWPFVSELYEYVQSLHLSGAILSVLRAPRKPTFNVTDKGITLAKDHISDLARPLYVVFAILAIGTLWALFRLATEPVVNDLLAVVTVWSTFNLIIAGVGLGVVAERRELRRHQRLKIERRAVLTVGNVELDVIIDNVSSGGVHVRSIKGAIPGVRAGGTLGSLTITGCARTLSAHTISVLIRRVEPSSSEAYGLEFLPMSATQHKLVADLMYGDFGPIERMRAGRRAHKGLLIGIATFIGWSGKETLRSLRLAIRRDKPATQPALVVHREPPLQPSGPPSIPPELRRRSQQRAYEEAA